ncbi:anthranilate/para-aminobenzoate synthase component I [Cryobacterium sp. MP_M5]|uniref:anthranilate synthase component I family protein n=1 Tax=unclassified Cryobacterium TaxID=2649013 RepID=UPI0018CA3268|nr:MULTISPECIES: chorismate-binding protein [unclassified Cryobacterium]MBG6058320.1 anthranilate/para-aminobenzoate synthase component I [Cryobacterium sp. MP_M3]MEC5177727.1 anthranilate/para-aminobenzoate synthase component I [Cryobacterium sp. MP_M5]
MPAPIRRFPLPGWWDPEFVYLTLHRSCSHSFWLDAGVAAEGGFSYLGAADASSRFVTASVQEGTVTVTLPGPGPGAGAGTGTGTSAVTLPETIFEFLREDLAAAESAAESPAESEPEDDAGTDATSGGNETRFRLGWVGWLGYELGAQTVGAGVHESRYPDAALLQVDRAIEFDHAQQTVTLLARTGPGRTGAGAPEQWAAEVLAALRVAAGTSASRTPSQSPVSVRAEAPVAAHWRHDPERYDALIRQCQDSITAGDAYQLCLTNEIRVAAHPDPVDAYLRLRAGSPSHHGGLLRFGDTALLSASPEQFLAVSRAGRVSTRPIKGTRRRSTGLARDLALRTELETSDKERAENLMIVDLMRNDLGRIAELGSVAVTQLLDVESYAHVHQLVSTVEARLAAGLTGVDAVESCFPAGSMTGVPKPSAMGILDRLEAGPRGIYSGAFGYFGFDGAVDLAMVIRSIVIDRDGASIGTGGGITALSDPAEEIEETRIKAAALLDALGALKTHPAIPPATPPATSPAAPDGQGLVT